DPEVAGAGGIEGQPGRMRVRRVDGPAAEQAAAQRVLEDLVGTAAVIDDPERRAVGDDALGVAIGTIQAETARRVLTAGRSARGSRVLEDLVLLAIENPDVRAVGGNPFELRGRVHTAGRPGTQEATAGRVNVDVFCWRPRPRRWCRPP